MNCTNANLVIVAIGSFILGWLGHCVYKWQKERKELNKYAEYY